MPRSTIGFPAILAAFFLISYPAIAGQGSERASSAPSGDQDSAYAAQNCASKSVTSDPAAEAAASSVDLDRDLKILKQRQSELAQCISAIDPDSGEQTQPACAGELLVNFEMRHDGEPERDIPIGRLRGTSAFFYESGMTIDADGAPNAYHPDNLGLDDLANAGSPGNWPGLAKDADGEPFVQGPDDPFPGYYVSETALADRSKPVNDPTRYVDASKIPFVVLPGGTSRQLGARPGDFAVVFNPRNGKSSYAIFGDVGPFNRIGEGSMALADNIGIRSDARNGGARRGILYLVFPGSGNGRPRTVEEINAESQRLLLDWENSVWAAECAERHTTEQMEGGLGAN
jgi:glycosyl hydrolase group 75 (putative chitosanase)